MCQHRTPSGSCPMSGNLPREQKTPARTEDASLAQLDSDTTLADAPPGVEVGIGRFTTEGQVFHLPASDTEADCGAALQRVERAGYLADVGLGYRTACHNCLINIGVAHGGTSNTLDCPFCDAEDVFMRTHLPCEGVDGQEDDEPELVTDGGLSVDDGAPIDPLVCPRGHHSVKVSSNTFRCQTCYNQGHEQVSWPRSDLVDLRDGDPPLADDEPELVTDGGQVTTPYHDLNRTQRDVLQAVARVDRGDAAPSGQTIAAEYERIFGAELPPGRLYPSLDVLVEAGYVERGQLDGRTNSYELLPAGRAALEEQVWQLADATGASVTMDARADGGQR